VAPELEYEGDDDEELATMAMNPEEAVRLRSALNDSDIDDEPTFDASLGGLRPAAALRPAGGAVVPKVAPAAGAAPMARAAVAGGLPRPVLEAHPSFDDEDDEATVVGPPIVPDGLSPPATGAALPKPRPAAGVPLPKRDAALDAAASQGSEVAPASGEQAGETKEEPEAAAKPNAPALPPPPAPPMPLLPDETDTVRPPRPPAESPSPPVAAPAPLTPSMDDDAPSMGTDGPSMTTGDSGGTGQHDIPAALPKRVAPGYRINNRYRLVEHVATGGMGSVWQAHDEDLGRRVAIKLMEASVAGSESGRQRFKREAKAAARIETRHAAQVFDHGIDGDLPFIVMELLRGEDLATRLKRVRRLSLREAAVMVSQACKALRIAHNEGVWHRDLKPGNVFFHRTSDDEEVVKILDFGIAKIQSTVDDEDQEDIKTRAGTMMGSPHYMSPEQGRGAEVDHRADLWSLAVVVFRALTGKRPFPGKNPGQVIVQVCTAPIPRASAHVPELGPEVDHFFDQAMLRDAEQRFQSAEEFSAAFRDVVERVDPAAAQALGWDVTQPPSSVRTNPSNANIDLGSGVDIVTGPTAGTIESATTSFDTDLPPRRGAAPLVLSVLGAAVGAALAFFFLRDYLMAPVPPAEPAAAAQTGAVMAQPAPTVATASAAAALPSVSASASAAPGIGATAAALPSASASASAATSATAAPVKKPQPTRPKAPPTTPKAPPPGAVDDTFGRF
jgi:serine/threonine-protein kinase